MRLRELALFAGAGGGILGGLLLGRRTVCAVELDAYCRSILLARQRDGILEPFPIWDDVRTFGGRPWRGSVDVISGGFPCQDISAAGRGGGLMGRDLAFGWSWPASLAKYDRVSCSWRTRQCLLLGGLDEFSETWPRWGSMRDGELLPQPTSVLRTSESGYGLWPTPRTSGLDGGSNSRRAAKARGRWPTPTVRDSRTVAGAARKPGALGSEPLVIQVGGTLNPMWVEWLMGWPSGWVNCEPLATDKFQQWLALHGTC